MRPSVVRIFLVCCAALAVVAPSRVGVAQSVWKAVDAGADDASAAAGPAEARSGTTPAAASSDESNESESQHDASNGGASDESDEDQVTDGDSEEAGSSDSPVNHAVMAVGAGVNDQQQDSAERRVAVVALGEGAGSGSVMQTLLGLLDDDGFDVVQETRLRRRMAAHLVPKSPAKVTSKFVGLTTRIGDGIEKFFYKGNRNALDLLTPAFNLGMAYPEVLARRPDLARPVFEAGLVMIRAYRNLERTDDARRLARALVETFPGFETRAQSVPPPVARLLATQQKVLDQEGGRLELRKVAADGCQAMANGTAVGDESFAVAAGEPYFVTVDCGGGVAPIWRIDAAAGKTRVVPVAPDDPLDYDMPNAGFRHRELAESYLTVLSFWADVPQLLGVADAPKTDNPESVILVHVRADGSTRWSDRTDQKTVRQMLSRVMDGYDTAGTLQAAAGPADASVDWVSWGMLSAGVALAAVGSWGVVAAGKRSTQLACSPSAPADAAATAADCSGVTSVRFAGNGAFESAKAQVNMVYGLSAAGLTVGAGLAGWGIYRLVTDQSAPRTAWRVGVGADGARVGAVFRF